MRKVRRTIDALPCDRRDMLAVLIVHLQRYFLLVPYIPFDFPTQTTVRAKYFCCKLLR